MKNKNYYPFDRNHYYYGKLLTVRDFEIEQRYGNNKRRILNKLLNGTGIVAGLGAVLVDDQSVSVEMGMALDYHGREIVVQEPVLKRLKLIDGFEHVKDSLNVYLCIEYDEHLTEPVHSVVSTPGEGMEGSQYNRYTESYRLFLTDEPLPADALPQFRLEKSKTILFQNDQLTVEQIVPRFIQQGGALEIVINITKRGTIEPVTLQYAIHSEHLKDEQGKQSVEVFFQEKENKTDWSVQKQYTFFANQVKKTTDQLTIPKSAFTIHIGKETYSIQADIQCKVQVIEEPVRERIIREYYNQDFGDIVSGNPQAKLYLAKLNLITSGDLYIIESLETMPFNQYAISNELLQLLVDVEASAGADKHRFHQDQGNTANQIVDNKEPVDNPREWFATGIEEVDMGLYRTKNKRFYSHEIAHTLGNGPVAIVLAVEDTKQYAEFSGDSVLVFGDNDVFDESHHDTNLPDYRLGALAYPDKGTFRIGLHILDQGKVSSIKVRWWAYKHVGEEQKNESIWAQNKIKIMIEPNTITVAPREKVHFTATIEGTNNKECRWDVKEENGGEIDYNGVYEAPNAEGVFEIVAQSVKFPQKKASAYIVVKA